MKNTKKGRLLAAITAAALCTAGPLGAAEGALGAPGAAPDLLTTDRATTGSDWVVKSADSICGVSTARRITNPAKVDYDKLLGATSEMKEIKRDGIDPKSAHGQALVTKARNKVREAAKSAMSEKGHCSVWKKISHKEGKAVVDLTSTVEAKLN